MSDGPQGLGDFDADRRAWITPPPAVVSPENWAAFGRRLKQTLTDATSGRTIRDMPMDLPPQLLEGNEALAEELLRGYLAADTSKSGGVAYSGSQFDTWDGGGHRSQVANVFTDADINAVAMLSVEIPARAVIEIVLRQRGKLSALLEDIPGDVDLHEASAHMIGKGSSAWRLWETLEAIHGVGKVTVSKLCARKRPRLLPIYDQFVEQYVGPVSTYWERLRQELSDENATLAHRLLRIRETVGASDLSILRVFDIIAWRSATN